jgi:hypothetical protein
MPLATFRTLAPFRRCGAKARTVSRIAWLGTAAMTTSAPSTASCRLEVTQTLRGSLTPGRYLTFSRPLARVCA